MMSGYERIVHMNAPAAPPVHRPLDAASEAVSAIREHAPRVRRTEVNPTRPGLRAQESRPMLHKRIVVTRYGGPDNVQVVEEERPEPRPGEVRVRVLAAGVSMPDVMAREGVHPETPRAPFTPGWDLVGVVDRLGPGVLGLEPGQTVAAMPIHGAYAEYVCLPQDELVPVPPGLDAAEAVSLVLNYITAYQMLHRSARV
jgi:NADPH2:quinone reductase